MLLAKRCAANAASMTPKRQLSAVSSRSSLNGRSPRAIAQSLNKDGIPGPAGRSWGPSTIYGNWQRGTGILNNELYVGRLVWNRQQFIKDPNTGRRQARLNPETKWIIEEVPHLRIIDDHLWSRLKSGSGTRGPAS